MAPVQDSEIQRIRKDPAGLEIARYWQRVAAETPDGARRLLSYMTSSLLSRGWLGSADKLLESAAEQLGEPEAQVRAEWDLLLDRDLLQVDQGKIVALAGLFSMRPTGMVFRYDSQHEVHLLGPLAALAVSRAVLKSGEVRGVCASDMATKLVLGCDAHGIATRHPESMALFLPGWDGSVAPSTASMGGGLFRDDEALSAWQDKNGDPDGMPIASVLLPMAGGDIADSLGKALESLLNHLPDFD